MLPLKRTYDLVARADGRRVLVERLWPLGMLQSALEADASLKDVTLSTELRQWFGRHGNRWEDVRRRYGKELNAKFDAWASVLDARRRDTITLLYSAHGDLRNGAVVRSPADSSVN